MASQRGDMEECIALGYIGVHYIFQLALAAQEIGRLGKLYISMIDRPGFVGGVVSRLFPNPATSPLDSEKIESKYLKEIPVPLIVRKVGQRIRLPYTSIHETNLMFDRAVAKRIRKKDHRIFVGTETCCLNSFKAVKERGGLAILDCPGIPTRLLEQNVETAAEVLGIKVQKDSARDVSLVSKDEEISLADRIFVCSSMQRDYLMKRGVDSNAIVENPLWVNPHFKKMDRRPNFDKPLRVLFAAYGGIQKGFPFFIEARSLLSDRNIEWTVVGGISHEVARWAGEKLNGLEMKGRIPQKELAKVFASNDVLVFPSLGDSFGFTVHEAMATGAIALVSEYTGAPIAHSESRIPFLNVDTLAQRIAQYDDNREMLAVHSQEVRAFVEKFTAEAFRERAKAAFFSL